jgi:PAS domain S-box/diguanylate cyclase (GGDEF) domain
MLLMALVLSLSLTLAAREEASMRAKVKAECDYFASHIEADLRSRLPAIQRMARSWEYRGGMSSDVFVREAISYISDEPGFQALEQVGPDLVVRAVVPIEGNEKALGLNLSFEKSRREALVKARATLSPVATPPVDLVQGGKGFLVFFPLSLSGGDAGYILAVFRIREWLDYVFSIKDRAEASEHFRVAVLYDSQPVYEQAGWAEAARYDTGATSSLTLLDHRLGVRVRPTENFLEDSRSLIPWLALIGGALVSGLAVFVVRLYQRSNAETWKARDAGTALEREIRDRVRAEDELQSALLRIEWATKSARMGVWSWDLATDKLGWNERMYELLDIPPDISPVYSTWRGAVHPADRDATEDLLQRAVLGKATFNTEFRCLHSDGSIKYIKATARVERDLEGKPHSVSGLNWDISAEKAAETALKASEERVRLLLNSTAEAIYGIDLDGNCVLANNSCARLLGYSNPELLLGKNMHNLIHHSYADGRPMAAQDCRIYQAFREGAPMHVDDEVLWRADGSPFPAEYWSYPQIVDGLILGAVVTFIDITERSKAEETIKHMATHDSLTDLPRLPLGKTRLDMARSLARRNGELAAALFIDLDGFKAVNDSYGHEAGDETLREVGRRLIASLRASDSAARIGGDEFLVVLGELKARENAGEVAGKLLKSIAVPILYKGERLSVGASIGIALFPSDAESVEELIRLADEAMYEAKRSGKNRIRFANE